MVVKWERQHVFNLEQGAAGQAGHGRLHLPLSCTPRAFAILQPQLLAALNLPQGRFKLHASQGPRPYVGKLRVFRSSPLPLRASLSQEKDRCHREQLPALLATKKDQTAGLTGLLKQEGL